MRNGTLLIIGAAGDVGRGIVRAALESGRTVVAAGRDPEKLSGLAAAHPGAPLHIVAGDLRSEEGARQLWASATEVAGAIDAAVVSVNTANRTSRLDELSADELAQILAGNVLTHFNAAKVLLEELPEQGILIGIGGGTADFIMPKMATVSMGQAALRMLYRGLAKERQGGAEVRELLIVSMVAGESNRDKAPDDWIRDVEIGTHICAILDNPGAFPKPILQLSSRQQAGQPDQA